MFQLCISSRFTSQYVAIVATHSGYLTEREREPGVGVQWGGTLTFIVKHFNAVPESWTSMSHNSNTIFPLITYARTSEAIKWFWELSSIFNPSPVSVGPRRVKPSMQNQSEAGICHTQSSSKKPEGLVDSWWHRGQPGRPISEAPRAAKTPLKHKGFLFLRDSNHLCNTLPPKKWNKWRRCFGF